MSQFVWSFRDFQDLLNFEDDSSDDENFNEVEYDKDLETLADSMKPRCITGVEFPFKQLKERMSPITDDGLILKEVLKQGVGLPIPEKSIVYIHYDAFLDGQKEAFDSTRLRDRKPFKFQFGDGRLFPGLEIGIQTMKEAEISRIMVSPDYAFGEMGCPPQISPNAEILYEVQILKFIPKDVVEFEEMSYEDREKATFEKIIGVYQCDNQLANELFRQKLFKQAIPRYCRAVALLEEVSVFNEEADKRKEYLLKLYLNLAQCFLNIEKPKKCIIYAELALEIDPNNPKGLYRMGKALYLTGSYERAQHYLCEAKKHKPFEKCVNKMIKELQEKHKSHLDWEREFCKGMLKSEDESQKPESDEQELHFLPAYDISQLDVFKFRCTRAQVCQSFNMGIEYHLF